MRARLKEKDRSPTANSYMWVQTGGPPHRPVVLYDYDPSRSAKVPVRLLEGFNGYLMTDATLAITKSSAPRGLSGWRAGRTCVAALWTRCGCNPRANAARPMRRWQ